MLIKLYRIRDYDFKLIVFVTALAIIGIYAVSSANESYHSKQLFGVIAGTLLMILFSLFDYTMLLKLYWFIYILNIVLLLAVKVQGVTRGGATRWIVIGGVQFQPSETAKIAIILFFAAFFMKHYEEITTLKVFILTIVLFAPVFYLIYSQPDMSTSIVLVILFCILFFAGKPDILIGP